MAIAFAKPDAPKVEIETVLPLWRFTVIASQVIPFQENDDVPKLYVFVTAGRKSAAGAP
jgi:hypothetical protein